MPVYRKIEEQELRELIYYHAIALEMEDALPPELEGFGEDLDPEELPSLEDYPVIGVECPHCLGGGCTMCNDTGVSQ